MTQFYNLNYNYAYLITGDDSQHSTTTHNPIKLNDFSIDSSNENIIQSTTTTKVTNTSTTMESFQNNSNTDN